MLHITFVENRNKTKFWTALANSFQARGHTVSWIVQNPMYAPKTTNQTIHELPFPKKSDLKDSEPPESMVRERGRNYFGTKDLHYDHYQTKVDLAIQCLDPDVVIGEPTLFHELLVIENCGKRGIPYLHPTMARYPGGRFLIMEGDTQQLFCRSGEQLHSPLLETLATAIAHGASLPSYMQVPNRRRRIARKIAFSKGLARTLVGRWRGERYNTPSLLRKLSLNQTLRSNLRAWAKEQRRPNPSSPTILYPLQMQPEANIDVWGRPFSDQIACIKALLSALPENGQVAVKANPKSKYEVSGRLIALAQEDARVVLLPLDWNMKQAHEVCLGAVTVSGTVGYEAIFGRGRCISLRHPIIEKLFPSCHADSPEEAVESLLTNPNAGCGSEKMGRQLLKQLWADSYNGTVNDFDHDPACASAENIHKVTEALLTAITDKCVYGKS